jgi:GntR family transcriptional regulator
MVKGFGAAGPVTVVVVVVVVVGGGSAGGAGRSEEREPAHAVDRPTATRSAGRALRMAAHRTGPTAWLHLAPLAEARELMQCCSRAQHRYTDAAMVVTLDPKDGRPLYLQIVDEVRRALVVGSLRPEDPLPSVRELAAQLVVNPRTVSQAYGELERQGIVYVRRGQGTFVSANAQPDREERRALSREVARRALREAWRNGVGMEELVKSIREVAQEEGKE